MENFGVKPKTYSVFIFLLGDGTHDVQVSRQSWSEFLSGYRRKGIKRKDAELKAIRDIGPKAHADYIKRKVYFTDFSQKALNNIMIPLDPKTMEPWLQP